jgi:hypothetical protein
MSYDRIWVCSSLKRTEWIEATTNSRRLASGDETFSDEAIKRELLAYGNSDQDQWRFAVRLCTAGDLELDEIYLFLNEPDARRFFQGGPLVAGESGYHGRDFINKGAGRNGCDVGWGFNSVTLWIQDEQVAKHTGRALAG